MLTLEDLKFALSDAALEVVEDIAGQRDAALAALKTVPAIEQRARVAEANAAARLDLIGKQNEKIFRMRDLAAHALSHLSNGETQSLRKALEEIAATPL